MEEILEQFPTKEAFEEFWNANYEPLTFQDALTEAFYDKNPEVYEAAFALFEASQMEGNAALDVAEAFHLEYNRLYKEFMLQMFDAFF